MRKTRGLTARHFKREYWDDLYQNKLQRFDGLKSLDVETKNDLRDIVARLLKKSVEAERKSVFTIEFFQIFFLFMGIFFLLSFFVPIYNLIVDFIFIKENNLFSIYNTDTIISAFIVLLILLVPFIVMVQIKGVLAFIITIFSLLNLETFIFIQDWNRNSHYIINGVATAILIDILLYSYMFVFDRIFEIYSRFIESRIYTQYSLSAIVDCFIHIIYQAETIGNDWIELKYKEEQLAKLELAAKSMENYFLQCSQDNDIVTNNWVKETAEQVAAAIRGKKIWILTPKNDTNIYFIEKITSTLLCILKGNWDALERLDLEKPSSLQSQHPITSFLLSLLRTLFLMSLPIIVFLIFQLAPLVIPEAFRGYIVVGLFLWELLTLLVVFDPNVGIKVSAIKDLASILPSRSDSKS